MSSTSKTRRTSTGTSITSNDDNNNTEFSGKNPTKKKNVNGPTTNNVRLRVQAPSSTSSISSPFTDRENTHNNEKTSTENHTTDQNISEIVDETNQVEQIENVRNHRGEIMFRIKLINENESKWISSKVANRKYPQAVIEFWENLVEFT